MCDWLIQNIKLLSFCLLFLLEEPPKNHQRHSEKIAQPKDWVITRDVPSEPNTWRSPPTKNKGWWRFHFPHSKTRKTSENTVVVTLLLFFSFCCWKFHPVDPLLTLSFFWQMELFIPQLLWLLSNEKLESDQILEWAVHVARTHPLPQGLFGKAWMASAPFRCTKNWFDFLQISHPAAPSCVFFFSVTQPFGSSVCFTVERWASLDCCSSDDISCLEDQKKISFWNPCQFEIIRPLPLSHPEMKKMCDPCTRKCILDRGAYMYCI